MNKRLIDYLRECVTSTPANTTGMGNPVLPSDSQVGTDGVPVDKHTKVKNKKKNRKKSEEE